MRKKPTYTHTHTHTCKHSSLLPITGVEILKKHISCQYQWRMEIHRCHYSPTTKLCRSLGARVTKFCHQIFSFLFFFLKKKPHHHHTTTHTHKKLKKCGCFKSKIGKRRHKILLYIKTSRDKIHMKANVLHYSAFKQYHVVFFWWVDQLCDLYKYMQLDPKWQFMCNHVLC